MARKPADLLAASPKPSGRQVIWQTIRKQRDGFTRTMLSDATDIHPATIKTYLQGLEAAGYIEHQVLENSTKTLIYRLIKDVGVEAPRVTRDGRPVTMGLKRENMWRTMRSGMVQDFAVTDLVLFASTESHPVSEVDAQDYCKHLAKAGYLRAIGHTPTRYRFLRPKDTGPLAPMVQRTKVVFDPNLGEIVWNEEIDA